MRYYDLKRNWRKVEPHLSDSVVQKTLVRDFNRYTMGLWNQPFRAGQFPREFESCDWDWEHRGPQPRFWKYVKHAACHWLVNFNLSLAQLVLPDRPWRILTSQDHSTTWDGKETLFDFNFLALGVSPDECFEMAKNGPYARQLGIGRMKRTYYAQHWPSERKELPDELKKGT